MHKFRSFLLVFLLVAGSLFNFGCKNRDGTTTRRGGKVSPAEVLKKNEENRALFHTISIKGKGSIAGAQNGSSFSFSYRLNMAQDSCLRLNLTKFSLPAATILIDQDSVRSRRLDTKQANICDLTAIQRMIGLDVDLGTLQGLLIGEPSFTKDEVSYVKGPKPPYQFKGKVSPYVVDYFIDGSNFKLVKMAAKDNMVGKEFSLNYSEFKQIGKQLVPGKIEMLARNPEEVRIVLEHQSIEIDPDKISFAFKIPKSYEKVYCK